MEDVAAVILVVHGVSLNVDLAVVGSSQYIIDGLATHLSTTWEHMAGLALQVSDCDFFEAMAPSRANSTPSLLDSI